MALIWPKIWLGLASSTRFSSALLALGWLMLTCACAPTLKLCQLIAAFWLDWLMLITAPACLTLAWPALSWPPLGNCVVAGGLGGGAACARPPVPAAKPAKASATALAAELTEPPARLPQDLAISITATKLFSDSFQRTRWILFIVVVSVDQKKCQKENVRKKRAGWR